MTVKNPCSELKLYIVDDHPIMREVLSDHVETHLGMNVMGTAPSAEVALNELAFEAPDLMIIDMSLPEMNGADLAITLRKRYPGLPCLILSAFKESAYVRQAFAAGANAYVLKGNPDELSRAIQRVLKGEFFVSASLFNAAGIPTAFTD